MVDEKLLGRYEGHNADQDIDMYAIFESNGTDGRFGNELYCMSFGAVGFPSDATVLIESDQDLLARLESLRIQGYTRVEDNAYVPITEQQDGSITDFHSWLRGND